MFLGMTVCLPVYYIDKLLSAAGAAQERRPGDLGAPLLEASVLPSSTTQLLTFLCHYEHGAVSIFLSIFLWPGFLRRQARAARHGGAEAGRKTKA